MTLSDPIAEHHVVAVLGLGASGIGACNLLRLLGKRVIASDVRESANLSQLDPAVEVHLGGNTIGDASAVVLSPALNPMWPKNRANPTLAPIFERWRCGELAIWSEIVLAAAAFTGRILTVGGTDGKSTTAALAAHLLSECGFPVAPLGNSWTPFSQVLADGEVRSDYAVLEVSAFQLWEPHALHPDVAILTNVQADHLEHYEREADYIAAKRAVFRNLTAGDVAVLYASDDRLVEWRDELRSAGIETLGYDVEPANPDWNGSGWVEAGWNGGGCVRVDPKHRSFLLELDGQRLEINGDGFGLMGRHNLANALAALLGAVRLLPEEVEHDSLGHLEQALSTFRELPHRLEVVRVLDGVRYYNDSKATNVHAALTGIAAIDAPVVAIVGGVDKELDLSDLIDVLSVRAKHVIVIGELRRRLSQEATGRITSMQSVATLEQAVEVAYRLAEPGDAVVLSPAASSFDMFRSFEHRGDVFSSAVRGLPGTGR